METQYDVDEWAKGTNRGRRVYNYNPRMFARDLVNWDLLKMVVMQQDAKAHEKVYLWQSKAGGERELVRISIAELHDWRQAQQQLLAVLSHSMRPGIPLGNGKLVHLGDVSFVGCDPQLDVPTAISFTRGNVCLSVNSVGEKSVDVSAIADLLDRALDEITEESRHGKGKEKGKTRLPVSKTISVKAGETKIVIEKLPTTAPPETGLKIISPDGELSRRGDALVYVSPRSGKKQIATYALRLALPLAESAKKVKGSRKRS